ADPGILEAPALALFRAIPLVCVEVESLHSVNVSNLHRREPMSCLVAPPPQGTCPNAGPGERCVPFCVSHYAARDGSDHSDTRGNDQLHPPAERGRSERDRPWEGRTREEEPS